MKACNNYNMINLHNNQNQGGLPRSVKPPVRLMINQKVSKIIMFNRPSKVIM